MHVPTVTRSPSPREQTTGTMQIATLTQQRHHQWCRQSLPRAPPACPAAQSSPPYTAGWIATIQAESGSQEDARGTHTKAGQNTGVKPGAGLDVHKYTGRQQAAPLPAPSLMTEAQSDQTHIHVGASGDGRLARASTAALCSKRQSWGDGQLVDVTNAHHFHALRDALCSTSGKNRYEQWAVRSAQGGQGRIVSICIFLPLAAPRSLVSIPQTCTIPRQGAPRDASPHLKGPRRWRRCKRRSGVQSAMVWCRRTLHPHAAVLQKPSAGKQEQRAAAEGVQPHAAASQERPHVSVSAPTRRVHLWQDNQRHCDTAATSRCVVPNRGDVCGSRRQVHPKPNTQQRIRHDTYLQNVPTANAVKVRLLHLEQVIKRDAVVLPLEPNRDQVPASTIPTRHTNTAARHTTPVTSSSET